METENATAWYESNAGNDQGLIIDEGTGRSVAVAYDKRDARLIAAAPEMAEGYREILALAEIDADDGDLALEALSSVRGIARALLAKIKKGA